ncbi:hypothetical protein PLICRDRAFT_588054 [Plicaturopsis crispa FD-325 SS-3]|nr:hypothetical protein PLICRDRAFT_588054 [Plicaturopsis crispa FD-325 SS-3]
MYSVSTVLFALTSFAATNVLAQSSSAAASLPSSSGLSDPCILQCVTTAASQGGCSSASDLTCICSSAAFQSAAESCLKSNCSSVEQAAALQLQQSECASVSSSAASGSGSATSTSASVIPSSSTAANGASPHGLGLASAAVTLSAILGILAGPALVMF